MHNIEIEDRLAALSAAIADRTRARMLCLLMDGRAYTATELSAAVEVAPSTASAHLAKLLEQRLIACVKQGATAISGWPGNRWPQRWRA